VANVGGTFFEAAVLLFNVNNPFLWFSAAILGHHALEMLLKSALIRAACPVREGGGPEDDFVWGHDLEKPATFAALQTARLFSEPSAAPVKLNCVIGRSCS